MCIYRCIYFIFLFYVDKNVLFKVTCLAKVEGDLKDRQCYLDIQMPCYESDIFNGFKEKFKEDGFDLMALYYDEKHEKLLKNERINELNLVVYGSILKCIYVFINLIYILWACVCISKYYLYKLASDKSMCMYICIYVCTYMLIRFI
jgi:hypothetical protein